jgi:hypothetical protein
MVVVIVMMIVVVRVVFVFFICQSNPERLPGTTVSSSGVKRLFIRVGINVYLIHRRRSLCA